MNSHRIYEIKKDIDTDAVRRFYEKRAKLLHDSVCERNISRYSTVTLNEENAERWDCMEKKMILPLLDIRATDSVLDIGCGVGRWADSIIPLCGRYVGTDFSQEMIKTCKASFGGPDYAGKDPSFLNLSFQQLLDSDEVKGTFDVVLIAGVSMYINDDDLRQGFEKMADLLSSGGRLYLWESIGVGRRLTLDEIWSEALNSNYSAVYRTCEEYLTLLQPVLSISDIVDQRVVSEFDHGKNSDTSRWYLVLRKR